MPNYHVYVHYKDRKGTELRHITYNFTKEKLERQVAIPYMKNKPFFLVGKTIDPSSVLQILVYKSENNIIDLTLPNGKKVRDEEDVFYIAKCFSKGTRGVWDCTCDFITAPPRRGREGNEENSYYCSRRKEEGVCGSWQR